MKSSRQIVLAVVSSLVLANGVAHAGEWSDDVLERPRQAPPQGAVLPQTPSSLSLDLAAGEPVFVPGAEQGGVAVREKGFAAHTGRAGEPDLARRVVDVLLPFDADVKTLRLAIDAKESPVGTFDVRPVARAATQSPVDGKPVDLLDGPLLDGAGRDASVYAATTAFPAERLVVARASRLRQLRSVRLLFSPFRWNPATRALTRVTSLHLTLSWERRTIDPTSELFALSDPVRLTDVDVARFLNGGMITSWYEITRRTGTWDYVIILPRATKTGSSALSSFVTWKESQGHKVAVVSVEAIDASYTGSELADRLRAFLRDKYCDWGIRFVLLIGDPDPYDRYVGASDTVGSVPMKMAWPRGDGYSTKVDGEPVPTDLYYGDLSEDWDVDGDGYAGSYSDDCTVVRETVSCGGMEYTLTRVDHGFDFDQEVLVGRIPWDSTSKVDAVLTRTVDYESLDHSYTSKLASRRRVFLGMSSFDVDADMSYLGHQIVADALASGSFTTTTLYEPSAHYTGTVRLERNALITKWTSQGAGMVIWAGHGSQKHATIRYDDSDLMIDTSVGSLASSPAAFVFQGSCQNAWAETTNNLAHRILEYVAVATVAGTRNSFYLHGQTSFDGTDCWLGNVGYRIAKNYRNGMWAGNALAHMRSDGEADSASLVQNLMTYNLYGEPSAVYDFD